MTIAAMTEPAAEALHLPTVRAEGATLTDTAAKERITIGPTWPRYWPPSSTSMTPGAGPDG